MQLPVHTQIGRIGCTNWQCLSIYKRSNMRARLVLERETPLWPSVNPHCRTFSRPSSSSESHQNPCVQLSCVIAVRGDLLGDGKKVVSLRNECRVRPNGCEKRATSSLFSLPRVAACVADSKGSPREHTHTALSSPIGSRRKLPG